MNMYDISEEAQYTLKLIKRLEIQAKEEKSKLKDLLFESLEHINFGKDTRDFLDTIYELIEKNFISIKLDMNPYKGEIYDVESIRIKRKGRKYIRLYMVYNGGLDLEFREKPNNLDYKFRKLKKHGIYIILIAVIPVICEVVKTIIEIINNSK